MRWTPHATVATIVEDSGRFLIVEEEAGNSLVLNQPAGHLEEDESFVDAARRETLEETGWHVEPEFLLGLYVYKAPANGITYHRACFIARAVEQEPHRQLDEGIVRAVWMTRDEIAASADRLRSQLVLKCIDDYLAGTRYPLSLIHEP
ncbi:NUDIX hydrolase [Marinobacterium sp. D7]|uniref:NUDIX hydrolase n=1 Tax=Marinobacterium ramblicola TaxID=2849041 RepID=UPI001C2D53FF|nr:NUDIX hydrolase [Marinobacterium ramblicola]MBV1786595.1 NUDIX hydrolase [Marinobacterium ramblicola]